jgi:hypothetical protein
VFKACPIARGWGDGLAAARSGLSLLSLLSLLLLLLPCVRLCR